ncbi:MAG: SDR family NAD(P)-dependent oxidoreductase, partial [Sphaerochaetaceae bacterium]|nr:SDR family NAD(P)-dependent oxidoreductase [Sphaerochaetaceae bacterium]
MIFVSGGAGFIGSHTCVELLNKGYEVLVVDNLCNSHKESLERVKTITGKSVTFVEADLRDEKKMDEIFSTYPIECVIHFGGLKAVGESVQKPLEYYENNLYSTLILCKTMIKYNVKAIVFSSSATVYAGDCQVPFTEDARTGNCTNPYGWTKYMIEQILKDIAKANPSM